MAASCSVIQRGYRGQMKSNEVLKIPTGTLPYLIGPCAKAGEQAVDLLAEKGM